LEYKLEQGKGQTFFTQPFFIIVVDKKYVDYNVVEVKSWD
jgi:putative lipoprotein